MSRSFLRSLLTTVSVTSLLPSLAYAQSAPTPLPTITVTTPLDQPIRTTTKAPSASPIRQAATPAPAQSAQPDPAGQPAISAGVFSPPSAIDTLGGATGVGRDDLQTKYQTDNIATVVRDIPGVAVQQTARDTGIAVNIRGLQDFGRVNVLVDGMRQNFQRSGHSANGVFYLEPDMVKGIDVTRGPTATVYGSGAIGGVAAFELIDADDILRAGERVAMQTKLRWSTNGEGPFLSVSGAARIGNFDMVGQVSGRDVTDYRDGNGATVLNSREATGSALLRSRWTSNGHQISGTYLTYNSRFVDSAVASGSNPRESELENTQFNVGYRFQRPDTPLIDASVKVYRNETDLQQRKVNPPSAGSMRGFNVVTDGVDASNVSRFGFTNGKLALSYGVDAFRDQVKTFDTDPGGNAPALTPSGERRVVGGFLQGHLTAWSIFDFIGAVRYDNYHLESATNELDGSRISPKATVGVRPITGVQLFATYAEGYRAPSVTETLIEGIHPGGFSFRLLPNPNLRPEVAHTVEGGINLKYDGVFVSKDAFRAKATIFQNKVTDFIDGVYSPTPAPFGKYQYQNLANVTLDGVELEAAYDARSWFMTLSAHRIRGTNDATGEAVLSVPADQVALTYGLRALDGRLVYGARGRFVAAQDRVPTGTAVAAGYSTLDLFAKYQATDAVTVNLNVDNVTDKQYTAYRDQSASPGLNARLGVTVRFGAP